MIKQTREHNIHQGILKVQQYLSGMQLRSPSVDTLSSLIDSYQMVNIAIACYEE